MAMDRYVITGKQQLEGRLRNSGAKNSSLPLLAASLLVSGKTTLLDIPHLADISNMIEVLEYLGAHVEDQKEALLVDASDLARWEVDEGLMRQMRASNLILGPILARNGRVRISKPGGCAIGSRPMDQHIKGLQELGVKVKEKHGYIEAWADQLQGAKIYLDLPSVGATENLMMAAVLAKGTTTIYNAAREPEIIDLQNFLNKMGAKVRGAGMDVLRIEGVSKLYPVEHTVIPDRIEAGTHMVAAVMTQGDIEISNVIPEHLEPVTAKLLQAGAEIILGDDTIRVKGKRRIKGVDCKTMPHPGFPTDMQPQFMALLSMAEGTSIITETIFENRFQHVDELRRMGAQITVEGRTAIIRGVKSLEGAFVEATDLRAGAALFLAALAAEEATVLEKVGHIDRGYDNLEEKYRSVGAKLKRVKS
ncbi:UDP-N-acetylglucosamine 1-carboxyvinyltransferase [Desulfitobacterium hafniense DCB-2]|uniref:UDP-N-acetylglucosamine 1-carboxyvinyltransferase n=2 Tax=Desulfitobacterium hafniense TaxID=49338 RepID=A0A098B2B6_DESHA|nr:UDP-N-acetylglucosamine 1-carboxyvinyltransferase [Desulfitobacterium hafniense]ACL22070.1 UDP-N-acetylglucosamine 1-carboxyvinyltransferase [Desulfitobacterium hafniense DCB-2]CDX03024.1 UDP-N-acetylglucosamine 1-carboxyvinyltransferase 2 [Desulfitobacterium hafniense]